MEMKQQQFTGNNKLLLGIVLGVITFWLFAQSLLNLVPTIQHSFSSSIGTTSIAISITAYLVVCLSLVQVASPIN